LVDASDQGNRARDWTTLDNGTGPVSGPSVASHREETLGGDWVSLPMESDTQQRIPALTNSCHLANRTALALVDI
jgi:hypothetical protein